MDLDLQRLDLSRAAFRAGVLGAVMLGLLGTAGTAAADPACGPRDSVVRWLALRYAETPVGVGSGSQGDLVELYASPMRTTWSILVTRADGAACFLATGESWQEAPLRPGRRAMFEAR